MMKSTVLSLGVIGCLMVGGVGGVGGAAADDDDENGRAVLAVRLVFKGSGLSSTVVQLSPRGGMATTDARGFAVFNRLQPGNYTITVNAKCHTTRATVNVQNLQSNTTSVMIEDRCPSGDPDVTE